MMVRMQGIAIPTPIVDCLPVSFLPGKKNWGEVDGDVGEIGFMLAGNPPK